MKKIRTFLLLSGLTILAACSANPQATNNDLLIRAAEGGKVKEMVALIKGGADINAENGEGWTPYLAASSNGHFGAMSLLRGLGARTDVPMDRVSLDRRPVVAR